MKKFSFFKKILLDNSRNCEYSFFLFISIYNYFIVILINNFILLYFNLSLFNIFLRNDIFEIIMISFIC